MVRELLVPVHGHALAVPAKLTLSGGGNGARAVAAHRRALLEGEQLLGAERLVVDLGRGLDEVLEVGAGEEVAQVHEFAVVLVLNCGGLDVVAQERWCHVSRTVDHSPTVLAAADLLAVDDNGLLRADDGKGKDVLRGLD